MHAGWGATALSLFLAINTFRFAFNQPFQQSYITLLGFQPLRPNPHHHLSITPRQSPFERTQTRILPPHTNHHPTSAHSKHPSSAHRLPLIERTQPRVISARIASTLHAYTDQNFTNTHSEPRSFNHLRTHTDHNPLSVHRSASYKSTQLTRRASIILQVYTHEDPTSDRDAL